MTLAVLRNTDWVFCRMLLYWDMSDVFRMIELELGVWGRRTRGKAPFPLTLTAQLITADVSLSVGWSAPYRLLRFRAALYPQHPGKARRVGSGYTSLP